MQYLFAVGEDTVLAPEISGAGFRLILEVDASVLGDVGICALLSVLRVEAYSNVSEILQKCFHSAQKPRAYLESLRTSIAAVAKLSVEDRVEETELCALRCIADMVKHPY